MKRKVLALLLALTMMLGLSVTANAADTDIDSGVCGKLAWKLDKNYVLTISGSGVVETSTSSLPWDIYSDDIVAVVMEEGVTGICGYGFSDYTALKTVTLPSTLTTMGEHAFEGCTALKSVVIPGSLATVPSYAFKDCTALESLTFGVGVVTIGRYAFQGCTELTTVTFPEGVTGIGDYSFSGCTKLTELNIPVTMTSLGTNAFYGCDALTTVNFSGNLLQWLELNADNAVTGVHVYYAAPFTGSCGDTVTFSFYDGVLIIDGHGLMGYTGNKPMYDSADDTPWYPIRQYIESIVINSGITLIGDYAFADCYNVTDVSMSKSVINVGKYAFSACDSLKMISMPGVQVVDVGAFMACYNLRAAAMPAAVKLDKSTFDGCTALEAVYFGKNLIWIGEESFNSTSSLAEVYYAGTETNWKANVAVQKNNDYLEVADMNYSAEHAWIKLEAVAPTCTETGLKEGVGCFVCGEVKVKQEVVKATGHKEYISKVITPATCGEDGLCVYSCRNCEMTRTDILPALGHKWKQIAVVSEKTETTPGIVEYECENCHETYEKYDPIITRIYGSNRSKTALAAADTLKKALGVTAFDTIILASGTNFADALAGSYLASVKEAPILLHVNGSEELNQAYIESNLAAGGTVYLLGGTAAVPAEVEGALLAEDIKVERLYGENRFATNIAILEEAGVTADDEIIVSTGYNFADSLSASATGLPILLVNSQSNKLTEEQKDYLSELAGDSSLKLTIVGGVGAVSDGLAGRLAAYGTVERVYGNSRYLTSVAIAERFFGDVDTVYIAYGKNFPDGLSGGPLAYAMNAPLLLVESGKEAVIAEYVQENGIGYAYIMGGTSVVSDSTVNKVFGLTTK